jgi:hypothetical protein
VAVGTPATDDGVRFTVERFGIITHLPREAVEDSPALPADATLVQVDLRYENVSGRSSAFSCNAIRRGRGMELVLQGDVVSPPPRVFVAGSPSCGAPLKAGGLARATVIFAAPHLAQIAGLYLFDPAGDDPADGGSFVFVLPP